MCRETAVHAYFYWSTLHIRFFAVFSWSSGAAFHEAARMAIESWLAGKAVHAASNNHEFDVVPDVIVHCNCL